MKLLFLFISPIFSLNYCNTCKHFTKGIFTPNTFAKCNKFQITNDNVDYLIDGKKEKEIIDLYYCAVARKSERLCGVEGKGYESKYENKYK